MSRANQKGSANNFYGKHHSEETRRKLSELHKGMRANAETRQKMSESHKGCIPWNTGKTLSDEHKKNIGAGVGRGENNSLYGTYLSDETKQKIRDKNSGVNHPKYGTKASEETKQKMREKRALQTPPGLGKIHSAETKRKMRLTFMKRLQKLPGRTTPNYNPKACRLIEEYGKLHGYNFQHAENGGELYIKDLGYWVDGYDKEKNVVIEYYERWHRQRKERDLQRKQEIQALLKCEFIELKAWELKQRPIFWIGGS